MQVTLIRKMVKRGRRGTGYHIHPRRNTGSRGLLLKKETTWSFFSDHVESKNTLNSFPDEKVFQMSSRVSGVEKSVTQDK